MEPEDRRWFQKSWAFLRPQVNYCEQTPVIEFLASITGYPLESIEALKLRGPFKNVPKRLILLPDAKYRSRRETLRSASVFYRESYCPECLREGFYLRRHWHLAFFCCCPAHQRELIDACPHCGIGLDFSGCLLADPLSEEGANHHCQKCGFDMTEAQRDTSGLGINSRYLDFQRFLVTFSASQSAEVVGAALKDLCALLKAIATSDVSLLVQQLSILPGDRLWDALRTSPEDIAYCQQPCVARHFFVRVAHLCLERGLERGFTRVGRYPRDRIDMLAPSVQQRLRFVTELDYAEFLKRQVVATVDPPR